MTVEKIALRVQNKRMTQKEWQSSFLILLDGEIGVESDTGYLKVGNGKNRYVDLPYLTGPQGAKGQDGNVKFEELSEGQLESLRGPQGVKGDRGMRGPKGDKGDKGEPGKNGGIHTHEISEITGLTGKLNKKADKSVAQMWKLFKDNGAAFRTETDLNLLDKPGFYFVYPAINAPVGNTSWCVYNFPAKDVNGYVFQLAYNVVYPDLYYRYGNRSRWFEWKQLATTDTTDKLKKQLNSSDARITELENQVKILTAKLDRVIADGA